MYTNLRQLKQWQPLKDVFGSFLCTSYCARCTPLINIIGSKSRTLTQQKSPLFSSSTSFEHSVQTFFAMTSY